MTNQHLNIVNRKGHTLSAVLELPANQKPNYYAIFAHCFTCNKNFNAPRNISRALTAYGIGVINFDFTGLGRSQGDFTESTFSANINDLIDVHEYIKTNYKAPSLLIGHSLGGAASIVAASLIPEIIAVATIGAPASSTHVTHLFSEHLDRLKSGENVPVNIGGRPFTLNKEFIDELSRYNVSEILSKLNKPILILHSPSDTIVEVSNAQTLYKAASHPKSFVSLDDADHLLSRHPDGEFAASMIGTWVKRYLPVKENQMSDTKGEQLVARLNLTEDKFTTYMQTRQHSLIADEPLSFGGDDFGPSPYDYLVAGLASCSTMTVKLYAERKKWDLKEVFVYVTYAKKHIDNLSDEDSPRYMDHISKKLQYVGDLSTEQKVRLTEIASRCPVHLTLKKEVIIDTSFFDE